MDSDLSLYFQLEDDSVADLEILSAAAIAWVETMRAVARVIDPDSDIRVGLVDVDRSSAIYNTVVDWFERTVEPKLETMEKGWGRAPRSKRMLLGVLPFLIVTGIPTYNYYFGEDGILRDDEDTAESPEEMVKRVKEDPLVETASRKFFRTIEREPKITGVGVKDSPDGQPIILVPSDQFAEAGGLWVVEDDGEQVQVTTDVIDVVLVKPALVHTPRAWTFKPHGLPEFDAVMRDPLVLQAIESGEMPNWMREGVTLTVRFQTREVMRDGQWKLVRGGRSILRVISPKIENH